MNLARKAVYISEDHCEGIVRTIGRLKGESPEDGEFIKSTINLYPSHPEEYALKCAQECEALFQLPENEIEPAFLLIFGTLRRAQTQVIHDFTERIVSIFLKDTQLMAYVKIKVLSAYYNSALPGSSIRRILFMAVLKLVADNDELASITPHLQEIDSLLDSSNTSLSTRRSTYLTISNYLHRDPNYKRESYEFTLKYLATFEEISDPSELSQTLPHAECATKMAINTPGIYTFDTICSLKAIKHMFSNEPLYLQLINLLISGKLKECVEYCEENVEFLERKEIDSSILLEKIHLIAICKVFEKNLNTSIPFQKISETIDVPVSEVENWIIRLSREDLASVMIDQKSQLVVVSRCLFTEFGDEQWVLMEKRLRSWAESTEEILEVLKNTKLVSDSIQPHKSIIKK